MFTHINPKQVSANNPTHPVPLPVQLPSQPPNYPPLPSSPHLTSDPAIHRRPDDLRRVKDASRLSRLHSLRAVPVWGTGMVVRG